MGPASQPGRQMERNWYLFLHARARGDFLKQPIRDSSLYLMNADGTEL